jgi:isocitrate dehydrogenase
LARRGELDDTPEVVHFAKTLEAAIVETIEGGTMTGDLTRVCVPPKADPVAERATSEGFIDAVRERLVSKLESLNH